MKRILQNGFGKSILCLLVALLSGGTTWAAEEVYKTALFAEEYFGGNSVQAFTATPWTATNGDFSVSLVNFKNRSNNTGNAWYPYIACGRNGQTQTSTISTTADIDAKVTKVVVTFDAMNADWVNSINLYTSSDGSNWGTAAVGSFEKVSGQQAVNLTTPTANLFYKVEVNSNDNGNKDNFVKISKIEFYHDNPLLTATPVISGTDNKYVFSEEDGIDVSISCETSPAIIQYSIDGGINWISYSGSFHLTETTNVIAKATGTELEGMITSQASKTFTMEDDIRNYTWDLRDTSSPSTNTTSLVEWKEVFATMMLEKKSSTTNANSHVGGNNNNNRYTVFSKNQDLTITPVAGYSIISIEFECVSNYIAGLTERAWTNASVATSSNIATITPNDGTKPVSVFMSQEARALGVTVNYAPLSTSVTIGSTGYATYVALADIAFEGLSAYIVTEQKETSVTLTEKTSVPEGTPVVLKGEPGKYTPRVLNPNDPDDVAEDVTGNLLIVSDGTIVGGSGAYALANKSKGVGFYPVKSGVKIPAGKPYLQVSSSVKPFYGFEEDDATGIEILNADLNLYEGIYNLAGQRLQKMQKGINIINGKKILK